GLVINVGGHTLVLRMDRLAERPQLAPLEVALWHKEGHFVKLKAGKVVEVGCDKLIVNAAVSVAITSPNVAIHASGGVQVETPTVSMSQDLAVAGTATAQVDVVGNGTSLHGHVHGAVKRGTEQCDPPV
ncbi:MAG: hypothetical protein K2W93_04130, partial [Burkholderiaceae bacterium]|nr:hypothetical protein [Burkholderiaceae bacterium]